MSSPCKDPILPYSLPGTCKGTTSHHCLYCPCRAIFNSLFFTLFSTHRSITTGRVLSNTAQQYHFRGESTREESPFQVMRMWLWNEVGVAMRWRVGGAKWCTLLLEIKRKLWEDSVWEIPIVDALEHMNEKPAIGHVLTRPRINLFDLIVRKTMLHQF